MKKYKILDFLKNKSYVMLADNLVVSNMPELLQLEIRNKFKNLEPTIAIFDNIFTLQDIGNYKVYVEEDLDQRLSFLDSAVDVQNLFKIYVRNFVHDIRGVTNTFVSIFELLNRGKDRIEAGVQDNRNLKINPVEIATTSEMNKDYRAHMFEFFGEIDNLFDKNLALVGISKTESQININDIRKHIIKVSDIKNVNVTKDRDVFIGFEDRIYSSINTLFQKGVSISSIDIKLDKNVLSINCSVDSISDDSLLELIQFANIGQYHGLGFLRFMANSLVLIYSKQTISILLKWDACK